MRLLRIAAIVSAFAVLSCATGQKALQRGNYYKASMQAVDKLRTSPDNAKAAEALVKSYPLLRSTALNNVKNAFESEDFRRYEEAIVAYSQLNEVAREITLCPAAYALIPDPGEYQAELREAQQLVAEVYYAEGVKAMAGGTVSAGRAALDLFLRVQKHSPGYRDIAQKIDEARYMATLRVVVEQPVMNPQYAIDSEFFYNRLMLELARRGFFEPVKFYTYHEAAAQRITPDQVITLDFVDFTVGNTRETNNTSEMRKDDVLIGQSNGQPVYGTVKAKFTRHRLEIASGGAMWVRIADASTGRIVRQTSLRDRSVWFTEWASFNGDERALSKEQLALASRRPQPIPPYQELFASFAMPLYAKAADFIARQYQ